MREIGKLRRSGLVSTFGPGAIVDFRDKEAAVSGIITGLEEWDSNFGPPGTANPQSTIEPRLLQKLRLRGVQIDGFRLPPVISDGDLSSRNERLVAVEFPRWFQCPACYRLGHADVWGTQMDRAARSCQYCSDGREVHVIPVRFVMACERGHLDDFPWHTWVAHTPECENTRGFLQLKAEGAGLAGMILSCLTCKARRSMDGVFNEKTWAGLKCRGHKPWLAVENDNNCSGHPRTVQRGATNLYFPATESALDIPPWSDPLQQHLGVFWAPIMAVEDSAGRASFIKNLSASLKPALDSMNMTIPQLQEEVERRVALLDEVEHEDLRVAEYRQFVHGTDTPANQAHQFEIRQESTPDILRSFLDRTVRVVRLREVRALTGFTRIHPPGEVGSAYAPISIGNVGWLPAIEVFGEGIFVNLSKPALEEWESNPVIMERTTDIATKWVNDYRNRHEREPDWVPSSRFLLIHTLAHALMRQLTLDCGYSTASLRERLYVDTEHDMCGLLIYTATTDADGTLGGLQRQGRTEFMRRTLPAAIQSLEWCSSDPLCISGEMVPAEIASGAACHACVLSPETSCEHFNHFLDRALLVGTPQNPEIGFFRSLLRT